MIYCWTPLNASLVDNFIDLGTENCFEIFAISFKTLKVWYGSLISITYGWDLLILRLYTMKIDNDGRKNGYGYEYLAQTDRWTDKTMLNTPQKFGA